MLLKKKYMQRLTECPKGCRVKVRRLYAQGALKQRLVSFGIMKGTEIEVLEFAPAKSTVEIKIGRMRLALRNEEARMIEVDQNA